MPGAPARWSLEILGPDGRRRTVPVTRELTVGRERDVTLRLDDASVSRHHARFFFDEEGTLWIEDQGSGNGVVIDGERIQEATALRGNDALSLGAFTLTVRDAGKPKGPAPKVPKDAKAAAAPEPVAVPKKAPPGPPPPAGCALRGRTGPFKERDFPLVKPAVKVGRVQDGNDIAVQDDSVSREHARFSRAGRGYVLRDLGSANGTSVNGERIVERPVQGGDIVRFGTVEFQYFGPAPMIHQPLDPQKKKLLVGGAVGLFVLLFAVGALKLVAASRDQAGPATVAAQDDPVAEAERRVGMAQDERRDEHWERALSEYQEAIKLDPINMEARKGLKEVEREIRMKQYIDRAKQRVDVGQEEEGVDLFLKVEPASTYYPRAQAEIQRLALLLVRRYLERCHAAEHAGDQASIADACGHYLNILCNCQVDEVTLKAVRAAEKKLGPKIKEPWSCPPSFKAWSCPGQQTGTDTLDTLIARKYPDPKTAENVRIYAVGQAREALIGLRNLAETPGRAHDPQVDKLENSIGLAFGAYTDGASALANGDVRAARKQWDLLFESDKQILPAGYESTLVTQARAQLASYYYKQGQLAFQQERYPEAFQQYAQGQQVRPGDKDIQQGFIQLEAVAQNLVANAGNCSDLRKVLSMTVADPPSYSHKEAVRIGKEQHCKGF